MADITAIVLTLNEEKNIVKCLDSVKKIVKHIIVVDGFSSDKTCSIAESYGAEVYQIKHISYANDFMYGVKKAGLRTKWLFRLDADEQMTPKGADELERLCNENENTDVNGIEIVYQKFFLGKALKHGEASITKLAVFKAGMGQIEDKLADEHIYIYSGRTVKMKEKMLHYDFNSIEWWITQHNKYSTREMEDYFNHRTEVDGKKGVFSRKDKIKSFLKRRVYYSFPPGFRCKLYYIYRYYFRLGFLDGKEGKIYAFLLAYWYRYLVDAKIYEKQLQVNNLNSQKTICN